MCSSDLVSLPNLSDDKTVRFLFLPQEDDPDSFVRAQGAAAFEKMVGEARPLSEFLLGELQGRVDMGTLEGRSRLIAEAKPMLQKIAAPALQLQMLKQLGTVADMSYDEVSALTGIRGKVRSSPARAPAAPASAPRAPVDRALEHLLLRCVLNQPGLALDLPVDLLDNNHPAGKALVDLATFVKDVPDASVAVIIDHFSHGPHGRTLAEAQASAMHMQIEDEDQKIEFRDALQHLNARRAKGRLAALEKKFQAGGVTDAERAEYHSLIKEFAALKGASGERSRVV